MAESHYFDVNIAKLYGVHCAVILQNILHWVRKNEANGKNFYEGTYWTYNSTKAFSDLFPYLTKRQIETALKKLRDEGIIITGNFNSMKYDRTLWYAITEKGKCILQICEMDITKMLNGNHAKVTPIPNINQNTKPNNKTNNKQFTPPTLEEIEEYCKSRNNNVDAKRFFDYFDASNWVDSKGNPVKNWKQKVITWENYNDNAKPTGGRKEKVPGWFQPRGATGQLGAEELAAIKRTMDEENNSADAQREREQLARELANFGRAHV